LNKILNELADFPVSVSFHEKEKKVSMGDFIEAVKKVVDYEQLLEELELAADEVRQKQRKSYLGGIAAFLGSWKGPDEGFVRYIAIRNSRYGEVVSLTYACLDPSVATKDIFQQLHAGVVMSGTLKPTFMYKDVLGIGERAMEKEYVSPFPPENKLSIIIPETSTKYSLRNELMFKKIGEKCAELCRLIPGNVALFFPSYDLRDKVGSFITSFSSSNATNTSNSTSTSASYSDFTSSASFPSAVNSTPITLSAFSNSSTGTLPLFKKFLWEKAEMSKEEKEQLLNQFRAEKDRGAVLLGVAGANFAEGIDLPGDLLNGVVVVGLPLARPDLITREVINYYDRKFGKGWSYGYLYPAMNKCLQSAGRCIRSETDRGVIVYLDERFAWEMYYGCFPRERLVVSKDYGRLLKEFFNK
ncbi:MAG: helicase C-terminal domain-containing protein, partial [Nanoarchaeota archaeon]